MKAYRYRLYPTSGQHVALASMLSAHAELYNAALQERRDAWNARKARGITDPKDTFGKVGIGDQDKQLTAIRQARPDQAVWSYTSQQQTLRRLNKAFAAFFERVKKGQTPGYPRFRSAARFDSVDFRFGDGIQFTHLNTTKTESGSKQTLWHTDGLPKVRKRGKREATVKVQGVGGVRVWMHRPLPESAVLKAASIKREGAKWFLVLPVGDAPESRNATGAVIGVDLAIGENGLAWTSDGGKIDNPRPLIAAAGKLADAQRSLARKKRGSTRRKHAVRKVAKLHGKVARVRLDRLHKVAADLVATYDIICVEAIPTSNMTRAPKPKPDPDNPGQYLPNGRAAKAGLNKNILDAGWSTFLTILRSKAACAGVVVVEVNPAYTSQTCAKCLHVDGANRNKKHFKCTSCGHIDDADINAANNILRVGLAQLEAAA